MRNKIKTKSAQNFFNQKLKDKKFKKVYDIESSLMDIAFSMVKARNRAGLSQADLAKKLKTTQSVVSRIENGNQNLSVKMLSKIAQVLGCHLAVKFTPQKIAA